MIGWLKRTPETSAAVAVPQPVAVEPPAIDLTEYEQVAKSIGLESPAMLRVQLLQFLAESGIRVYDTHAVSVYLDSVFGRSREWVWRPLRQVDADKRLRRAGESPHQNGWIQNAVYEGAVPLPVLLTVQRLLERFPDSGLAFFVSSEPSEQPDGDPFLAVTADRLPLMVIERWDEPNFRG